MMNPSYSRRAPKPAAPSADRGEPAALLAAGRGADKEMRHAARSAGSSVDWLRARFSHTEPPRDEGRFARGVYQASHERTTDGDDGSEIVALRREVRQMRALLHRLSRNTSPFRQELQQLRRAVDESRPVESGNARLRRLLSRSGIDGRLARSLLRGVKKSTDDDELLDAYRDALSDRIAVGAWPLGGESRRLVAVVGPPGVGKTTTAAKLAARAIADDGKTVTFVAGDTYRVAAIDQLGRYASLLGARFEVAANATELHDAVRRATTDVVIVDTSGRTPTDPECVEMGLGLDRCDGEPTGWENLSRHVLLCLPAAIRAADCDALVQCYAVSAPTAIAVTKLDLTASPGALVLGTAYSSLPVSTLCSGQRVPEDIAAATAGALLDQLAPRHLASELGS